ncbi:hypothetical protein FGB62_113g12 [Gracilaria domingensis]|nr:hypothetical protein FGB62_113g12 [Gracilaria domingensis]
MDNSLGHPSLLITKPFSSSSLPHGYNTRLLFTTNPNVPNDSPLYQREFCATHSCQCGSKRLSSSCHDKGGCLSRKVENDYPPPRSSVVEEPHQSLLSFPDYKRIEDISTHSSLHKSSSSDSASHPPTPLPRRSGAHRTSHRTASFLPPSATTQPIRTARQQPPPSQGPLRNEIQRQVNLPPNSPLPYFVYFSNMNPNVLGPRSATRARRLRSISSKPARLPRYTLSFDLPGIPSEPVFASVRPDHRNEWGVHGVLHWISAEEFRSVARSEGFLPPPFPTLARLQHVTCIIADGKQVKARTIVFQLPPFTRLATSISLPSRRYVQTAIFGAEFHGLDETYVDNVLRKINIDVGPLGAFGLSAVQRPHLLDRPKQLPSLNLELVMMLNPATSYSRSSTRSLWDTLLSFGLSDELYKNLLPFALFPFLIDVDSVSSNFEPELAQRLQ